MSRQPAAREPRRMLAWGSGLYLILTRPRAPHEELTAAAVELKVPAVQLREKDLDDDDLLDLALKIRDITRGTDTLFIMNDRPDLALAASADGVHVGRKDVPPERARRLMGERLVVGASGNTIPEARSALSVGADYLGIGPVFPTRTKPDARPPIGLDGLESVVRAVPDLPAVAVGGVSADNITSVIGAGARYAAAVSAICHADDPIAALEAMVKRAAGAGGGTA